MAHARNPSLSPRVAPPASQLLTRPPSQFTAGLRQASRRLGDALLAEEHLLDDADRPGRRVLRQPLINRAVHWLVALSTFSLFFSGFGQLPLYKRYMLSDVPGMAWTADYGLTLLLHYFGAVVLIAALSFHVLYHGVARRASGLLPRRGDVRESARIVWAMLAGRAEPPSWKYLAEQRLAYAAIGGSLLLLVVSGLVKVAKNLPGVPMPEVVVLIATTVHNLAAVLLLLAVVGHLIALVIPANQKLVGGMFHGKVDRAYVEHRHPLWYRELLAAEAEAATAQTRPEPGIPGASDRPASAETTKATAAPRRAG